jgi:hypothetical protein
MLDAARRALPMIEIDKEYSFAGPAGQAGLCGPGRRANRGAAACHPAMSAGMAAMLLAML